jgi:hypothetical protein
VARSKRLQITMSEDLTNLVDQYAKSCGISRAGAVSVLCAQALSQNKAFMALPDLVEMCKKENGKQEKRE